MQVRTWFKRWMALFGALILVAMPFVGQLAQATDGPTQEYEFTGVVETRPSTVTGEWRIDGETVVVTGATRFPEGLPILGDCVEVRYFIQNGSKLALRIELDNDCDDPSPGPSGTPSATSTTNPNATVTATTTTTTTTTTTATPSTTTTTTTTATPSATATTDPNATVTATPSTTTTTTTTVTPSPTSTSPGGTATPTRTPTPADDDRTAYGRIVSFPSGLFGNWEIGGATYVAREGVTEFEQEWGEFGVGRCVKVEYRLEGTTRVAEEIETRPAYRCPTQPRGVFFGTIVYLPDSEGRIGTWVIGGLTVLVDDETTFERGPFRVGRMVEVRFTVDSDGTLIATRIIGRGPVDDDDDRHDRRTYNSFGIIDDLPDGSSLRGTWVINGQRYQVTEDTRLRARRGAFEEGACVKVSYRRITDDDDDDDGIAVLADDDDERRRGVRLAIRIQTMNDEVCERRVNNERRGRAYAFVEEQPGSGYNGTWVIGNEEYRVTSRTIVREDRGALGVGSYVRVDFLLLNDGSREAREIRTLVPPGGGDHDRTGRLRIPNYGDGAQLSGTDELWYVDDQAYVINEATLFDETAGELLDGSAVTINAYTDEGGMLIATVIRSAENLYPVYLPMLKQ